MRKVVLSLVFFLAYVVVFAQKRYSYGFTVGSGVSFLTGSNSGLYARSAPKVDITAGNNGDVRVWKSFYLQAEINYQNIGGGKEGNIVIPIPMGGYDKYTFQYLSIPVLLKFKIPDGAIESQSTHPNGRSIVCRQGFTLNHRAARGCPAT